MATILMMSVKLATLGFLKTKVIWNKVYDAITFSMTSPRKFYHVTQILL